MLSCARRTYAIAVRQIYLTERRLWRLTTQGLDIDNLRDFGCKVQALVPTEHRKRLDAKPRNGIFFYYATGGSYLGHIPENGADETSTARTVVFYEDQSLPATDDYEVMISTQMKYSPLELVHHTRQQLRLETIEEAKEDVAMGPADCEKPQQQLITSTTSELVGVARL